VKNLQELQLIRDCNIINRLITRKSGAQQTRTNDENCAKNEKQNRKTAHVVQVLIASELITKKTKNIQLLLLPDIHNI